MRIDFLIRQRIALSSAEIGMSCSMVSRGLTGFVDCIEQSQQSMTLEVVPHRCPIDAGNIEECSYVLSFVKRTMGEVLHCDGLHHSEMFRTRDWKAACRKEFFGNGCAEYTVRCFPRKVHEIDVAPSRIAVLVV